MVGCGQVSLKAVAQLWLIRGGAMAEPDHTPERADPVALSEGVTVTWIRVENRARAFALAEILFATPRQGQERRAS